MVNNEAGRLQLGFGDEVVRISIFTMQAKSSIKVLRSESSIRASKRKNKFYSAKLTQDVEATRIPSGTVKKRLLWRINNDAVVKGKINGQPKEWTIHQGSIIGVYPKDVIKRYSNVVATRKTSPLL